MFIEVYKCLYWYVTPLKRKQSIKYQLYSYNFMNWNEWVNKVDVFIKLDDGQIFSKAKILLFDEPFLSITDKFGMPVVVNTKHILKIIDESQKNE